MDKLGFVKTVEAILSAVIIMSMYSVVYGFIIGQVGVFSRNPTTLMNDFLNMVDEAGLINDLINDYDYTTIDKVYQELFSKSMYYYFEPKYYEKIRVKSSVNKNHPNISFTYHFPAGVDENSVRLTNEQYELPTNAIFNWYSTKLSFNEDLDNSLVEVNISIKAPGINNKSFMFFSGDKQSLVDLKSWSSDDSLSNHNATLVLFVPKLRSNEDAYVFYAMNNSIINFSYPELIRNREVEYTHLTASKSTMAQVIFTPQSVNSGVTDTYYLTYILFSTQGRAYANINLINNTGINILPELDYLKWGNPPTYQTIRGEYTSRKIIPKDGGFITLTVYGGYS